MTRTSLDDALWAPLMLTMQQIPHAREIPKGLSLGSMTKRRCGSWSRPRCGSVGRVAPWRDLPDDLGCWPSVCHRFRCRSVRGWWSLVSTADRASTSMGGVTSPNSLRSLPAKPPYGFAGSEGRARRRPRQGQCRCRPALCQLVGAGGAPGLVDARGGRPAGSAAPQQRMHGMTGEVPAVRFAREERQAPHPLGDRPSFRQMRELTRHVQVEPKGSPENDVCVDVDTNHCSVPRTLIGAQVSVDVNNGPVRVHHAGAEVACHQQRRGRRERAVDRAHLHGVLSRGPDAPDQPGNAPAMPDAALPWHRPAPTLAKYEQVAGGGW